MCEAEFWTRRTCAGSFEGESPQTERASNARVKAIAAGGKGDLQDPVTVAPAPHCGFWGGTLACTYSTLSHTRLRIAPEADKRPRVRTQQILQPINGCRRALSGARRPAGWFFLNDYPHSRQSHSPDPRWRQTPCRGRVGSPGKDKLVPASSSQHQVGARQICSQNRGSRWPCEWWWVCVREGGGDGGGRDSGRVRKRKRGEG